VDLVVAFPGAPTIAIPGDAVGQLKGLLAVYVAGGVGDFSSLVDDRVAFEAVHVMGDVLPMLPAELICFLSVGVRSHVAIPARDLRIRTYVAGVSAVSMAVVVRAAVSPPVGTARESTRKVDFGHCGAAVEDVFD
jgi:hypothetical protein